MERQRRRRSSPCTSSANGAHGIATVQWAVGTCSGEEKHDDEYGFPLGLMLNCRVTKLNGSPRHLADLFRWLANTPSRVRMRITTDYVPTAASAAYRQRFLSELYVEPEEAERVVREAIGTLSRVLELEDAVSRATLPATRP